MTTLTTPTLDADIRAYLDAVEALLADLEPDELHDVLEDLELHLTEVRTATDQPLEMAVGAPEQFAADLRQSAGFPPAEDGSNVRRTLPPTWVAAASRSLQASGPIRAMREFLPELRPAWWVLRGLFVAAVIGTVTSSGQHRQFPFPHVYDSNVAGLLIGALAVWLSVKWGRARHETSWRSNAIRALTPLALFGSIVAYSSAPNNVVYTGQPVAPRVDHSILPANIHAYLPDGTQLEQVLLYNEVGKPIDLFETGFSEQLGAEFLAPPHLDLNGNPLPGLYPRELTALACCDLTGDVTERAVPGPDVVVPLLVPSTQPTEALDDTSTSTEPALPEPTTTVSPDSETTATTTATSLEPTETQEDSPATTSGGG